MFSFKKNNVLKNRTQFDYVTPNIFLVATVLNLKILNTQNNNYINFVLKKQYKQYEVKKNKFNNTLNIQTGLKIIFGINLFYIVIYYQKPPKLCGYSSQFQAIFFILL